MHDPYAALRYTNFRLFLSARFLITVALQMEAVVVGWQLYSITKDPFSLGLIGLAEAIPAIGISLYAGHVADLIRRKYIILSTYIILMVTALVLLCFSIFQAEWLPITGTLPIYCAIFISGIARGFMNPAHFSFMSQLVPKTLYLNSSTWNASVWQFAAISGPAIGGLIYGFSSAITAFSVISILISIAFIVFLFIENKPLPEGISRHEPIKERLTSGIKFVFGNQIILSAISLDLFAVLFGGAVALLPVFAAEILLVGPEWLGWLRSAPAIGSTLTALFLAMRKPMEFAGRNLLWAVVGFGVSMILFAISTNIWLSLFFLFLSGMFDNVSVVIRATLLQLLTPDHMRGRVSAVNSMFIGSSNEIGAFESGLAARLLGTVPSVIFGGGMTLLVAFTAWWKAPALKNLKLSDLSK